MNVEGGVDLCSPGARVGRWYNAMLRLENIKDTWV